MIGKHNTRGVGLRRHSPFRDRLSAVPGVLHAVVEGGRREPLRSWYAAVGVLAVVFVVVTSVGVISGRSLHTSDPIMVQPPGPAVPTPGGAPLTVPDGTRRDLAARAESGQTSTAPGTPTPSASPSASTLAPPRARTSPPTSKASTPAPPSVTPSSRPTASSPPAGPPPGGSLTARYAVFSTWQDGFSAGIELVNNTGKTQTWKLKLVHERSDGVRIKELWNATLRQGGATTNVFVGGTLAPGGTLTFGFNASKTARNQVHPTSCTINNRACSLG